MEHRNTDEHTDELTTRERDELAAIDDELTTEGIAAAVGEIYGDEAARLVRRGWTVDAAANHVQGSCDRELCTHPAHKIDDMVELVGGVVDELDADDIELARAAVLALFAKGGAR